MNNRVIRQPDSAGRIIIGKEYKDKQFVIETLADGNILLMPIVIRHEREAWLFDNPEALASVKRGIEQSARGETKNLGSFAQFAEQVDDEE